VVWIQDARAIYVSWGDSFQEGIEFDFAGDEEPGGGFFDVGGVVAVVVGVGVDGEEVFVFSG